MPMDFADKDGNLIDDAEWMLLKADDHYCRIAYDEFRDAEVSTVWLGALPSHLGIFETMVFFDSGDTQQVRYHTLAEAEAGHQAICAGLALLMPPAEGSPVAPDQEPNNEDGERTE